MMLEREPMMKNHCCLANLFAKPTDPRFFPITFEEASLTLRVCAPIISDVTHFAGPVASVQLY